MEDVTDRVLAWMQKAYGGISAEEWGATGQRVLVEPDVDRPAFDRAVVKAFAKWSAVGFLAQHMYEDVMKKEAAKSRRTPEIQSDADWLDKQVIDRRRKDFTSPYQGELLPGQLETHVEQCWETYCHRREDRWLPCTTIVQSSGFGKSRLVFELAKRTKDTSGSDAHMRVLYMCARDVPYSTDFPEATNKLRNYLFPEVGFTHQKLVDRLCRLFEFAMSHWDSVGNDWIDLFTDKSRDVSVAHDIEYFVDASPQNTGRKPHDQHSERRILVLAIDTASALLTTPRNSIGWLARLRSALNTAYRQTRDKYGAYAGICGIFIDTNPDIIDRLDPAAEPPPIDPSGRGGLEVPVSFAPFVLTQTMDVHFDAHIQAAQSSSSAISAIGFYQQLVLDSTQHEESLVSMGRPLWRSAFKRTSFTYVVYVAAQKLVRGRNPHNDSSFVDATMGGAASLLCRLGIRPKVTLPVASRCVSQFMSVLTYVSASRHRFVSTYTSDPILALGACSVWYARSKSDDHHSTLRYFILPRLRQLMQEEALEVSDPGILVARIVLLLAMDKTSAAENEEDSEIYYTGKFHGLRDFLGVLQSKSMTVEDESGRDVTSESEADVDEFESKWSGWKVGFSHFVELTNEPDEECLWAMLARRAAGVLPRCFKVVDLIIPVFKDTEVSVILVQVDNRAESAAWFPGMVSATMQPNVVFTNDFFAGKPRGDVVRIHMKLASSENPRRFFLRDPQSTPRSNGDGASYVLCMLGLDALSLFLSEPMVALLKDLCEPWGQPWKLIKAESPNQVQTGIKWATVKAAAMKPLAETVVESKLPWPQSVSDSSKADSQAESVEGDGKRKRNGEADVQEELAEEMPAKKKETRE